MNKLTNESLKIMFERIRDVQTAHLMDQIETVLLQAQKGEMNPGEIDKVKLMVERLSHEVNELTSYIKEVFNV